MVAEFDQALNPPNTAVDKIPPHSVTIVTQPQKLKKKRKRKRPSFLKTLKPAPKKDGFPAFYTDPQVMQARVDEYFGNTDNMYKVKTRLADGTEVEIPTPTLTDLVLFLGFAEKKALRDYAVKPGFGLIVKNAITRIERIYEAKLHGTSPTGAIFALKNFDWHDRVDVDHSGQFVQTQVLIVDDTTAERMYRESSRVKELTEQ